TALVLLVWGLRGLVSGALLDDPALEPLLLILVFLAPIQALDNLFQSLLAVFVRPKAIFVRRHVLGPLFRLVVVLLLIAADGGARFLAAGYVIAGALGVLLY